MVDTQTPPTQEAQSTGWTPAPPIEHPAGYVGGRLFSTPGVQTVLRTEFDVKAYQDDANGHLDITEFGGEPAQIDPETGRLLAFAWRLESSALSETRAILSTWTANEARIAAFIATWAFERFWMARALRDLLAEAGVDTTAPERRSVVASVKDVYAERVLPLVEPVFGGAVKEPVSAGHMARMALQEGALDVVERLLLARLHGKAHAVLSEVIRRRQEILRFFRAEAVARIRRSRAECAMARLHIAAPWAPLRVVGVPDADESFALSHIFGSSTSWRLLAESDAVIGDLLPGTPRPTVNQVRRAFGRKHHGL